MRDGAGQHESGTTPPAVELRVLGRFALEVAGTAVVLARTGQRLLARVALSDGVEARASLAAVLWPDQATARAQANLRSAVWRLPQVVQSHLVVDADSIGFGSGWDVDLHVAERLTRSARRDAADELPDPAVFRHDLLPHWDEQWVLVHRERHRQLRLHALEELARRHLEAGNPLEATDCALVAVAAEPLRESAQGLLLRGHLAAGNRAAALESYERFRRLLAEELGVVPGADLAALVTGLGVDRVDRVDRGSRGPLPPPQRAGPIAAR